ncbi:RelA/SpoT [Penicillium lagena]|uniref:RelA/SpoT n=1 Tax=Penicillium lagena TaxID=94218 RepID=UPI002540239E|nr:RelA/SpoT [Penicillium lagena]KAJ5601823.1 RelA/SpoT [Penicillium lagena]
MTMDTPTTESFIQVFMDEYPKKEHFYLRAATVVESICLQYLKRKGMSSRIKSRAKEPESLRKKLELRKHWKNRVYNSKQDIQEDIVDLSGVRIIEDDEARREEIRDFLHDRFLNTIAKIHPEDDEENGDYRQKSSNYHAVHYRVYLKNEDIVQHDLGDAKGGMIEIQVMTTTWSVLADLQHSNYKSGPMADLKLGELIDDLGETNTKQDAQVAKIKEYQDHRERKNNKPFEDVNSVGHYLIKWIQKYAAKWVQGKERGSEEALMSFLQVHQMNSHGAFSQLLQGVFHTSSESEYSEIAEGYGPIRLNLILYLIDRMLLKETSGTPALRVAVDNDRVGHVHKIQALMSTMIWIDKLFAPKGDCQIQILQSGCRDTLRNGLFFLTTVTSADFIEGKSGLEKHETKALNKLWTWFAQCKDRPIKLAFAMSNNGMMRPISEEKQREHNNFDAAVQPLMDALIWK